ncbi:hypothetical protein [Stutzerimonas kirkiae]|nr:hypothetical protein [Stutzerimonas kirkiae]
MKHHALFRHWLQRLMAAAGNRAWPTAMVATTGLAHEGPNNPQASPGTTHHPRNPFSGFMRKQDGGIAPFMVLALGGALLSTAYSLETSRMTNDAAQVKRATDVAAMAVGKAHLMDGERSLEALAPLAYNYVKNNLGMDSSLAERIAQDNVSLSRETDEEGHTRYTVMASFQAEAPMLGAASEEIQVSSTSEVVAKSTEIAIVLPNSLTEGDAELAALRRLFKGFANRLLEGDESDERRIWISLIPFSQTVNVYDTEDPNRIRRWATSTAIRPVELTTLFRTGIRDLSDRRMPDPMTERLCLNRGLRLGENYFWDQPPAGQFTRVYYRHDLPENHPSEPSISWTGPNPTFGQASGTNDIRYIIGDVGCPRAPLLPLTNDLEKIEERLDEMRTGFNTNYAIAMGWAAHALSPNMRGSNGWGDSELPLDFATEDNTDNVKIMVMLANTTGNWFDTDAYNSAQVGSAIDGQSTGTGQGDTEAASRRFQSLCNSFQQRKLKFHFIGVRPGDPSEFGRVLFDSVAGTPLRICAQGTGSMTFANATSFREGEDQIDSLLTDITDKIKHEYYVRLVE